MLVPALVRAIPSASRSLAALLERLRTTTGTYTLEETTPTARPVLLASIAAALGRPVVLIVPTTDVAERTYTDLVTYRGLGDGSGAPPKGSGPVLLMRPRGEALGAIESPSEQSARMTLLGDLALGARSGASLPALIVASLGAVRQYLIPRAVFTELTFGLDVGAEAGWDQTLARLHRLGYGRVDVVAAAGEYAVRGGIIDLFAASADEATRIEFFGDEVESIRPFDVASQRTHADRKLEQLRVVPWSEIPRDKSYREHASIAAPLAVDAERVKPEAVERAVTGFLERGDELPEGWVSLAYDERATLLDYLPADALIVLDEPAMLTALEASTDDQRRRESRSILAAVDAGDLSVAGADVDEALLGEIAAPYPRLEQLGPRLRERTCLILPGAIEGQVAPWLPPVVEKYVLETRPVEHFNRQITAFVDAVRQWVTAGETVVLIVSGASRLAEMLRAANLHVERETDHLHLQAAGNDGAKLAVVKGGRPVYIDQGSLDAGFSIPSLRLHVLGDRDIFGQPPKRVKMRAVKEGVPVTLSNLRVGDFVVHSVHGISQYLGLRTETILGATSDYLDLKFAGTDRMLVPVQQMHQVTKYGGADDGAPRLSKMGGADWARAKGRVSEALAKIAEGLVSLYAERELARGHAYPPDAPWQAELEEAFPYETTPDQQKAIDDAKRDMELDRPMDRLVCGDVGYGKTEVAIRAAFKAVCDKRQVAVLVPTTLLATQHSRNFATRFASFPITIAELSRFRTKKEQQQTLADLAAGKVDILVGTHRLLQKDVVFKDLGLIIVDEEQRFGVMHKERLKALKASVDVLTLSATPIPRTLQMSLLGMRDLSLIQTAPRNRMAVKTVVVPAGDAIVREAITHELDRNGQIYYVHNRIESIYGVARALEQLVPRARVAVGHGAMGESELEPVMTKFIEGEIDILVSTTIIENGIDIGNVNTIIINDADRFGLSQLYQLRGRVGRSNHQAYAYLLYQGHKALTDDARARLEAIREFSHLGSGLQVAMRDLEIRGAGNLLGAAQSGFIGAVGFETYCQLLAEAIAERRGEQSRLESAREAVIDVKLDAYIPNEYISQVSQKIAVYQELAQARTDEQVETIASGIRDRFGPPPKPLEQLVAITHLRVMALAKNVTRVVIDEQRLTFGVGSGFALDPAAIPQIQSLTKNRFRFHEGKITVDLPKPKLNANTRETIEGNLPLVKALLQAL